jgi:hypothetical protein
MYFQTAFQGSHEIKIKNTLNLSNFYEGKRQTLVANRFKCYSSPILKTGLKHFWSANFVWLEFLGLYGWNHQRGNVEYSSWCIISIIIRLCNRITRFFVAPFLKGYIFAYLLGAFFSFVFQFANNVSSIVCIVLNFVFTPFIFVHHAGNLVYSLIDLSVLHRRHYLAPRIDLHCVA